MLIGLVLALQAQPRRERVTLRRVRRLEGLIGKDLTSRLAGFDGAEVILSLRYYSRFRTDYNDRFNVRLVNIRPRKARFMRDRELTMSTSADL